jgi:hypothetical protein
MLVGWLCRCGKCRQIAPFVEQLQVHSISVLSKRIFDIHSSVQQLFIPLNVASGQPGHCTHAMVLTKRVADSDAGC